MLEGNVFGRGNIDEVSIQWYRSTDERTLLDPELENVVLKAVKCFAELFVDVVRHDSNNKNVVDVGKIPVQFRENGQSIVGSCLYPFYLLVAGD